MTALVTKHLPLVAGAPEGIKKLRGLILELAVRGRLLPTVLQPTSEVPDGWIQAKLGSILCFEYGDNLPAGKRSNTGEYPVYGSNGVVGTHNVCLVQHPCIVIGRKGSAGALNLCTSSGCCVTDVAYYCVPPQSMSLEYTFKLLHTLGLGSLGKGIKPGLNRNEAYALDVLVPPLAEQHRIVTKVDELMALCDRLEADQADAEAAHAQLVQALLDSLTQAADAADFRAHWQRLSEHFHTLFTTEASIDALKQTVLQLAVMGKLVQQSSDDEPAESLLGRIAQLKGPRRQSSSSHDISEALPPFNLPVGWCWTTLPEIGELARGKSKHRPRNDPVLYVGGTIPLIQTGDVARANGVISTSTGAYNAEGLAQSRLWPRGTMCITIAANIADSAILGFDACFPDSVVGFIPSLPELEVEYFEYFIRTAKTNLQKFAPSTAQKNINLEILASLIVPLPPAAELMRIVAKVDELMALCDQLKAQLADARQQHAQLATALLEQAVA